MKYKKIFIACDHAGFSLKEALIKKHKNLPWEDLGTKSDASVDYPDYADLVAKALKENLSDSVGVMICGSGQGMAIRANRYPYLRAALCFNVDLAKGAREHNNANVLCLGARFVDANTAGDILNAFLSTNFAGGRHERRVAKLSQDC